MKRNKTLSELYADYAMPKAEDVVKKMLKEVPRHTPVELGRALHSKLRLVKSDKQTITK